MAGSRVFILTLGIGLILPVWTSGQLEHSQANDRERITRIICVCESNIKRFDGSYRELLCRLASKGDYPALEAISNSSLGYFRCEACEEIVKSLPPRKAVEYCRTLVPGSDNWRAAFRQLQHHPKHIVLPYVLEMVVYPDPVVRHACYKICTVKRWNELIIYAHVDKNDNSSVCEPNSEQVTVGMMASRYLMTLAGKKIPESMPHVQGITNSGVGE